MDDLITLTYLYMLYVEKLKAQKLEEILTPLRQDLMDFYRFANTFDKTKGNIFLCRFFSVMKQLDGREGEPGLSSSFQTHINILQEMDSLQESLNNQSIIVPFRSQLTKWCTKAWTMTIHLSQNSIIY